MSQAANTTPPIRVSSEREGQLERIVLDRPKGNVVDSEMVAAIRAHVASLATRKQLKLLVFEGAGNHFSFGASVPEHLPGPMKTFLPAFHELFRDIESLGVPTAAVVRGQCLGGGFELALFTGTLFAAPTAKLGCPEVVLGVFPPVAAFALRWRTPGANVTRLITTGEIVDAARGLELGLVDAVADDPEAALAAWFDTHLAPKSAVALRFAWQAARRPLTAALRTELPELERLYLEKLMSHADPVEGITAFLEKRTAAWRHE